MNVPNENEPVDCLVVGAGMAGIMAARRLRDRGRTIALLEKEPKVGGRIQTRRIGEAVFDSGAQFMTLRTDAFKQALTPLLSEGELVEWSRGFPTVGGRQEHAVHPRYFCPGGLFEIPRHLSENLPVKTNEPVRSLSRRGDVWEVKTSSGTRRGRSLVLTPPVPRSKKLLENDAIDLEPEDESTLSKLLYDPCVTLLAVLSGPSEVPDPGGLQIRHGPLRWIADNARKGISDPPCLTIHADASFSREHQGEPDPEVARKMMEEAESWLGGEVTEWELLRWPESEPIYFPDRECLVLGEQPLLVLAGDAFSAARVEGAVQSGWAAANEVDQELG